MSIPAIHATILVVSIAIGSPLGIAFGAFGLIGDAMLGVR